MVGTVQDAAAAVLAVVAATAAAKAAELEQVARASGLKLDDVPDVYLTVVAATLVVTVLCGVVFAVLGVRRLGNMVRFVPYPVIGGFLAGTGWLLFRGGIYVASEVQVYLRTIGDLTRTYELSRWLPAFAFGLILLLAVRFVKRPLVIPAVIGVALVAFVAVVLVTGSSIEDVRRGGWLLGPFETARLWQPWTFRAVVGADWWAVAESWAGIAAAVFVAAISILFNISGSELILDRDLDTNEELRDAGVLNIVSGALGGIPGYHALSLTALAARMNVDARAAGLLAALVPLAAVVFGASVVELIPRLIVGGVLVYLGLSFMVEWVWDKRRSLPRVEYVVVLVILATIIARGFLPGVVIGLVLAVVLFAIDYGRIELVREVAFGDTYHSNVDRPPGERAELRALADRVQILRVSGFVFFGSTNRLLERIRRRVEADPPRFLVIDLRRVTGVDSSAVVAFVKVMRLAEASGFEIVLTGTSDPVRRQLERGGVVRPTTGSSGSSPTWTGGCNAARTRCSPPPGPPRPGTMTPSRASRACHRGSPPTWSACRCPKAPSCCTRTTRRGTSTCSRRAISGCRPSRPKGTRSGSAPCARGWWSVRSRSTRGCRAPPTWWPRPRPWSFGSAATRSSGWRPRSPRSQRPCTAGSRARSRNG